MRRSRFTDEQIALILRQATDGRKIAELCGEAGISIQTFYRWRSKFGSPLDARYLRKLRADNDRLRRLVADLTPNKEELPSILHRKR